MNSFICENINVNQQGNLTFAGRDVTELANKYGTPLYLMDEDRIRNNCRMYKEAFAKNFSESSGPLYAGKACAFKQIYRIMQEEDMGIDVVSSGEIYTAVTAGYDMSRAYFHGNNKTDYDIQFAMDNGIGCFVVDNEDEIIAIEKEAERRGITQNVILRLTPGIDPHTYIAVNTGTVDSKFGIAIETGQAMKMTEFVLTLKHLNLIGFHCHVGSQVFDEDVFDRAAVVMIRFIAEVKSTLGYTIRQLNMGGGYGVRYVKTDPVLNIANKISDVANTIKSTCDELGIEVPDILMEPGRSIVADAGMTLYTVGGVKRIPDYKTYVSIDGGMTDNPRYALYGSKYTCYAANKMNDTATEICNIVGRCCESGDIIQKDVRMPKSIGRGDIVAVCTTGAYNYSMASNYNRIARPVVVMLKDGESYVAVKRETLDDLIRLDV